MRKVKSINKENSNNWIQERNHEARKIVEVKKMTKQFVKEHEYLAFYAAIGSLESQFFDYASQDVYFPLETEKKFFRAYKYVVNFFNRLTEHYKEPNKELTEIGFMIYINAIEKLSQNEKTRLKLNLNMKNKREHDDFVFLAGIIQTIRLTNNLIKKTEEKWIKDYYFSFKIQMQMVVNIFDKEIKSQTLISDKALQDMELSIKRYKENIKKLEVKNA